MNEETIITIEELTAKVSHIHKDSKTLESINEAFRFAQERLSGILRNTGCEYINHSLNVAYILVDLNVDITTIIAAILHDILPQNKTTIEELRENFGETIAKICESFYRINKLELLDDSESSAIYLRKVLVGIAEDVRVIFIKLADRLHNMRTLWSLKASKQKQTAIETLNVLIPIAHRLGINSIKSELEDLCLKYTKPEIYNDITTKLSESRDTLNEILTEMKESISDILTEHGIKCEIKARVKSIHSIYTKLATGRSFNDIYDILALRVFLEKESDCYLAVGLIHSKYRPIPKRFKDFIAMPKSNMYQSLHTSVFGKEGYLFEIQLRTYEMDEIAEKGVASHWSYKEKGAQKTQNLMEQKLELFRSLIEAGNENTTDIEFASNANSEFLSDLIYINTPKGDVVELPIGSTPIDFAYRIHSTIGDRTIGAIVNKTMVPLHSELHDGDIVEIKTSKTGSPSKEWLKFVKTSQARSKIKAFFSKHDKEDYIEKGKFLLEKEIKKRKLSISEVLTNSNIKKLLIDSKLSSMDDIYLSLGSLRYTPTYIIDLIYEDEQNVQDILFSKLTSRNKLSEDYKNDIIVAGTDNIKVVIANCCKPILGDDIIGYISRGEGVIIHNLNCPNIKKDSDRLIEAIWNENTDKLYVTNLYIEVNIGKNHLIDIMNRANTKNVFIENVEIHNNDVSITYELSTKIKSKKDLNIFITELESCPYVIKVSRVK